MMKDEEDACAKCVRDVMLGEITTREQKTEADIEACDVVETLCAEIEQVEMHKMRKRIIEAGAAQSCRRKNKPQQQRGQIISRTDPDDRNVLAF